MGILHQICELSRRRRRALRARLRSKGRQNGHSEDAFVEYRGRESYEQQSPEGRGGQSDMFDQTDYPPRISTPDAPAKDDDGQLLPLKNRLV